MTELKEKPKNKLGLKKRKKKALSNHHYKPIPQEEISHRVGDYWDIKEYRQFRSALRTIFWENIEEINKNVNWTDEELEKIHEIKIRKENELHYKRFNH